MGGHPLMPPLTIEEVSYYMSKEGCPTPGCRGVGNAKGYEFPSHDRQIDCPYTPQNLNIDSMKPDRLRSTRRPGPGSGLGPGLSPGLGPGLLGPGPVTQSRSISTDSESIKEPPSVPVPPIKEAMLVKQEQIKEPT